MEIVCSRVYGEPKLKKPKFLNNKNLIGSAKFSQATCKVWLVEDEVYILHRDWFSSYIGRQEAFEKGLTASFSKKFVYNDNFGSLVLRNEAIIKFKKPDLNKFIIDNRNSLIEELAEMRKIDIVDLSNYEWEYLFEQVLDLLEEHEQKVKEKQNERN